MRKTITGTGGMLLLQTLKDAGVEYLFTNPGSAETGIFAALAEDGDQRHVVGKHEGLVAAMADGYHRMSGKVGVIIAHVMGGSFQLAGQLFNAQVAGLSVLVIAGDWTSELPERRGLAVQDRRRGAGPPAADRGNGPRTRRGAMPGPDVRRRRLAAGRAGRSRAPGRDAGGAGVQHAADLSELSHPASALLRHVPGGPRVREDQRARARSTLPGRVPGRARRRRRALRHADRTEPGAHGPPL